MATAKLTMLLDLSNKLFNNKLSKMHSNFNKKVDKMRFKFKGMVDEVPGLGRAFDLIKNPIALAAAGILAIGTVSVKSVAAAEKFDSAFLHIKQLNLDKPKSEIESYRAKIRDAAFDIGADLEVSTNAIYDLQSATGLYGDDAIRIYKKVGKFAFATGADINDSMNATTKAMKAFGIGVNDIDTLLESNAKTVQTGITTFKELAKVQTEYAGSTAAAGQTIDVGNKIFAMFTSISKNSDIAANQTKTFFDGLGAQAQKVKQHLNVAVFDTEGNMKDADKLLLEISAKFKNLSDLQITQVINKIGGPEGLRTALNKVKTGAEDMISTFNAFDSSQFSLQKAIENAEGDFGKMKEIFSNRLEAIFTKIGEKIIPMLAHLFDALNPVLEWLYQNMDWIVPAFGSFVTVLTIATAGVWLFNAVVAANPISLMVLAISALIALVVMAVKHFETWGATVLWLMGPFGRVISAILLLKKHWDSIVDAFNSDGILGAIKRIGTVLLDMLLLPVQQLLELISKIPGMGDLAGGAANRIKDLRKDLNLELPKEKEADSKKEKSSLIKKDKKGLAGTNLNLNNGKSNLNKGLKNVAQKAEKHKNIQVNIDALHKGKWIINNDNTTEGLTMEQVEEWFNNAMMRIIRNVENA